MGRIQSDIGLITGLNIGDTVSKLMAIAARPRDMLLARTRIIQTQSAALTELTALLVSLEYMTDNLGKSSLFSQRSAASSDSSALAATVTGTPALGAYQFTPLRMVQSQQLTSAGYQSDTAAIGPGTLSFRFGDDLGRSLPLDLLRGGEGFARGKIRVTDRSGASSEIDLTAAVTLEDVLAAINDNATINVTAVAHGDAIRLTDETGQTSANLKVQEVGGGSTAASLGLANINAAQSTAEGDDVVWLTPEMDLARLNDGLGVRFNTSLPDVQFTLRDGTTGQIDFSPLIPGGSSVDEDLTLADVLQRINDAAPEKLKAEISPDGDRLVITDLTTGENEFELESLYDSKALASLGLEADANDGVIQSRRLLGGAGTTLLSRLGGGGGLGELGELQLDGGGGPVTIDLGSAETLDDVLDAINASGAGITAWLNSSRTGIELAHTGGGSGHMLVASGGDGLDTAGKLQLAVDADVASKQSGDLHMALIGWNTKLADLNGGAGIARGKLTIVDSRGQRATLDLSGSEIQTVGQVITEINRLGVDVEADLNVTGDGIVLRDRAGGTGTLQVIEGSSTTAADLHLLGAATTVEGTPTIDGSSTYTVTLEAGDTLGDLRDKINDLDAGLQATIFSDGSSRPYRLSLASRRSGLAGRFVLESSGLGLDLQETAAAQDALLAMGDASRPASSLLLTSPTNRFTNALPGVSLEIKKATGQVVNVAVSSSDTNFVASVKTMVDNYNKLRTRLAALTKFDTATATRSTLTGDAAALRLDIDLPRLLTGRFTVAGSQIQSLKEVGITVGDDGTLTLDESKLKAAYADHPDSVEKFFSDKDQGVSAKFHKLLEQLGGETNSTLSARLKALENKVTKNQEQAERMQKSLDAQTQALYLKFYRMETAIAKLQSSLTAIQSIKYIDMYGSSSSS